MVESIFISNIAEEIMISSAQSATRLILNLGVKLFDAFRTDTMGKFGIGMILNVTFKPIPIALVITNFFAIGADGQQAA